MKNVMRIVGVMGLMALALACNKGQDQGDQSSGLLGPSPVEEQPSQVAASSVGGALLKDRTTFSISGTTVSVDIRMPYNEDLGNVILLVFDRGGDKAQRFIAASEPVFVKGPQGKITTLSVDIGRGCFQLQADLILADRLLDRHKQNVLFPQEFIDYENLQSSECGPTPKPSPTPCPEIQASVEGDNCEPPPPVDQCDNIEGLQLEVPKDPLSGLPFTQVRDEETGALLCTPPSTTDRCAALTAPEITGALGTVVGDTSVSFGQGTILPVGGTFDPALASVNRPEYGQDAVTFNTLYTVTYGEGLCSTSKAFAFQVEPKAPTCEQANEASTFSGNAVKNLTLHPGTPGTPGSLAVYEYTSYWDMNQGNDTARANACVNRGGQWLNDYNIPNDGTGSDRSDVCKFVSQGTNPPGAPGADMTLYNPPGQVGVLITPAVLPTQGTPDKYSVSVTGNYSIGAGDGGTFLVEIVYDPSNFTKKFITVTVACGEAKQGSFTWQQGDQYNSSPNYSAGDGHVTGAYSVRITKQ